MTDEAAGSVVVGVDGGNSKTDIALAASNGALLGAVRGPTASHQAVGLVEGLRRLGELVRQVAPSGAGSPDGAVADVGVYALAGADLPADFRSLRSGLDAARLSRETVVVNDAAAALRAGTRLGWGIALVCGAGVNAYGRSPDGRVARLAGLGEISGDWGGGPAIGLAALGAAVRARDGRGGRTALERMVPAHFGVRRPATVTAAVETGRIPQERLDELAPLVFETAAAGDEVARAIVERQSEELATMAAALARRLGLTRREVDVVLSGGVFKGYDPAFLPDLTSRVRRHVPGARLVRVDGPSVVGATLLALDMLSGDLVGARVEARLRAALKDWDSR